MTSLWKDVGKYSNFVHNPQLVFFHSNGQNNLNLKLYGKKLITFLWRLKTQSFKIIKHCTSSTNQNDFSSTNIDKIWTTLNWVERNWCSYNNPKTKKNIPLGFSAFFSVEVINCPYLPQFTFSFLPLYKHVSFQKGLKLYLYCIPQFATWCRPFWNLNFFNKFDWNLLCLSWLMILSYIA